MVGSTTLPNADDRQNRTNSVASRVSTPENALPSTRGCGPGSAVVVAGHQSSSLAGEQHEHVPRGSPTGRRTPSGQRFEHRHVGRASARSTDTDGPVRRVRKPCRRHERLTSSETRRRPVDLEGLDAGVLGDERDRRTAGAMTAAVRDHRQSSQRAGPHLDVVRDMRIVTPSLRQPVDERPVSPGTCGRGRPSGVERGRAAGRARARARDATGVSCRRAARPQVAGDVQLGAARRGSTAASDERRGTRSRSPRARRSGARGEVVVEVLRCGTTPMGARLFRAAVTSSPERPAICRRSGSPAR